MTKDDSTLRWIKNILTGVNDLPSEDTKNHLMESCGRACARSGAIASAASCAGDLDKFLSTLRGWVGHKNVSQDGETIHVAYEKCCCRLKARISKELSGTYCICSCGWLKEMFAAVVGRPVDVEIQSTIKRGANICRFTVNLSEP